MRGGQFLADSIRARASEGGRSGRDWAEGRSDRGSRSRIDKARQFWQLVSAGPFGTVTGNE